MPQKRKKLKRSPKKQSPYDKPTAFEAAFSYIMTGEDSPNPGDLREMWLGDLLIEPGEYWNEDLGLFCNAGCAIEYLLRGQPHILKRLPTDCFRHRFHEVKVMIRRIQKENESWFRDSLHKDWEWIEPLTNQWLVQLAQDVLAYKSAVQAHALAPREK